MIKNLADKCRMPFCYGGGITTVEFERNEYSFSEFLPQSEIFNLDSSQRFLGELLFPKADNPYDSAVGRGDDKNIQQVQVIKRIINTGVKYDNYQEDVASWDKYGDKDWTTDWDLDGDLND